MLIGLKQFERDMKEIEQKITGEVLKNILLKAVQPVVQAAASSAPTRRGKLKESMTAQSMDYASSDEAVVRVGPGRPEGSHGILLEVGTVHMTARPFLAQAAEARYQDVINIMEDEVGDAFRG